ncbi:MAG TPA: hypothetical protein VNZ52_14710 [Candidatus Thermoplasmatota archaeon]|nr:hypothetical protein [Candidatus Thermoplasmatota archaeon]
MWAEAYNVLIAASTVFALALFVLSFMSYRRAGKPRLLLVAVGFGLLAVKGIVLSLSLFVPLGWPVTVFAMEAADAVVLGLLFVASVRPT